MISYEIHIQDMCAWTNKLLFSSTTFIISCHAIYDATINIYLAWAYDGS